MFGAFYCISNSIYAKPRCAGACGLAADIWRPAAGTTRVKSATVAREERRSSSKGNVSPSNCVGAAAGRDSAGSSDSALLQFRGEAETLVVRET